MTKCGTLVAGVVLSLLLCADARYDASALSIGSTFDIHKVHQPGAAYLVRQAKCSSLSDNSHTDLYVAATLYLGRSEVNVIRGAVVSKAAMDA